MMMNQQSYAIIIIFIITELIKVIKWNIGKPVVGLSVVRAVQLANLIIWNLSIITPIVIGCMQ